MTDDGAILLWFRRDLRLADHPALSAAFASGRPVVPLFILDPETEAMGAAARWRLEQGLRVFARSLAQRGSRLVLRRGRARDVLSALVAETGAGSVLWSRLYDPASIARDTGVKDALKAAGVAARSFPGHLLFEPWEVSTAQGTPFRVFTPMWRALQARDAPSTIPAPVRIPSPETWPASDDLDEWRLGKDVARGADILARWCRPGEEAARERLTGFVMQGLAGYDETRDAVDRDGTSGLSEYLALGEIGAARIWQTVRELPPFPTPGAGAFLRQLGWRDFAHHLLYHYPQMDRANWRPDWDRFAWSTDPDDPRFRAWRRARTGVPLVDAGLRQMYVTGRMHNRVRMVVASYLTKHLMTHWRLGMGWFADCLTDWDPACNVLGWQWVAGSGPDAAPFFRVFNPETQAARYDPQRRYIRTWIAEGQANPPQSALDYFDAVPRHWELSPADHYPDRPVVGLAEGRALALEAYGNASISGR